jgi:branched-subunit amino acid aminotransferase/4-amino-4-deoxychorismate lyase
MTPPRSGVAPPPRLPDRVVWVDGTLCRAEAAKLSVFDRGARDGEGLFETIRVNRGQPFLWEHHLERLVLGAAELGFPVPAAPAVLRNALDEVLAATGLSDAVARITVTRGVPGRRPTRSGAWLDAEPLAGRLWRGTRTGAAEAIVSRRPFAPGPFGRYKTTSRIAYHMAREEARVARVDETLLVSHGGELLEGSVSNLFVRHGDQLLTPPLTSDVLPGITRAWVIAEAPRAGLEVRERRLTVLELMEAEEAFLTNSVQEIVPLVRLDGAPVRTGDAARTLLARYREAVDRDAGAEPEATAAETDQPVEGRPRA